MRIFVIFALAAATCEPQSPPDAPPPEDHCPDSCRQLQALKCKRGSDDVCADFDDAGECSATKSCVEACGEAPHAYPRGVVDECPSSPTASRGDPGDLR